MKRINDIFYSLQGEGRHTGRAAIFIRFSGCNLACPFCDTDFSGYREMTDEQIVEEVLEMVPDKDGVYPMIVLTGGEPTLQVDERLIDLLHEAGFCLVAMESNGTKNPPVNLDWLTVSPKKNVMVRKCQELKCIYDGKEKVEDHGIEADYYYLQPCDVGDAGKNAEIIGQCIEEIKKNPKWMLSLQTHKLIGFK
ncbi:7-carboxy-7-deazaguanine synthase QueE [Segatella albensis]|jgi:organic radical activating enzyme|uniref:7-carboxy-7-deazaguanine synthase QueE n=1 Tax=Segatella albensis TaxID=77768 RepID=UPI0004122B2F|nr:7-carboxy-7-deazaguanine synthase QueE [Segatella albensis]